MGERTFFPRSINTIGDRRGRRRTGRAALKLGTDLEEDDTKRHAAAEGGRVSSYKDEWNGVVFFVVILEGGGVTEVQ